MYGFAEFYQGLRSGPSTELSLGVEIPRIRNSYRAASLSLANSSQLIHGPISKHRLAVDITLIHWAEIATVVRHRAMISEHEITLRRHDRFRIGPRVGVGGRHVILIQSLAVHVHLAAIDANAISSHPNHALDIAFRWVARITEYDYITPRNRLQPVHELVDEDSLLIFEGRHHAGAFDFHRLIDEDNNERGNRQ